MDYFGHGSGEFSDGYSNAEMAQKIEAMERLAVVTGITTTSSVTPVVIAETPKADQGTPLLQRKRT